MTSYRRILRLHTLQRCAGWHEGGHKVYGPVVELEVGYRAASALLGQ